MLLRNRTSKYNKGPTDYPSNIIDVRNIKDLEDNYKNKLSHFLLKLEDSDIHLKCDDYDAKAEWINVINFFRDKYNTDVVYNEFKYKEKLDDETSLRIYAENEMKHWDSIKVNILLA